MKRIFILLPLLVYVSAVIAQKIPEGYTSLFNGKDFTNWAVPEGDNGHWKIVDGVIDYDGIHMPAFPDLSIPGIAEQPKDFVIGQGGRIGAVGTGPPLLSVEKGIVLW